MALGYISVHVHPRSSGLSSWPLLAFLMVIFRISHISYCKINARKIMIMMQLIGHAKRAKELLEYKAAVRASKVDYKQVGP